MRSPERAPALPASTRVIAALRDRLLFAASGGRLVAACGLLVTSPLCLVACSRGSGPVGNTGSTTNTPIRPVTPPRPFDDAAPASSTAPRPHALSACEALFFVHKNPLATGGPYRIAGCYTPTGAKAGGATAAEVCLPAGSPRLGEAIPAAAYASCVERGPELQAGAAPVPPTSPPASAEPSPTDRGEPSTATPGAPIATQACCYVFGAMGEGRPLWVMAASTPTSPTHSDAAANAPQTSRRLVRVVAEIAAIAWISQNAAGDFPVS